MPLPAILGVPGTPPASGATTTGTLAGSSPAQPQGVCVAFSDAWNAANPVWTRLDDPNGTRVVTSWSVDRGRTYELDKTGTGTATVQITDTQGLLDPTNSSSPYYGLIDPVRQACINLQNPVTGTWTMVFRGYVEDWDYTVDVSEKYMTLTLSLVDALDRLAAVEVVPGNYGVTIPDTSSGVAGDVLYIAQQVDDRIRAALVDAQWPTALTNIYSGNVAVQDTVYSPRSQILSVIQDAADAEWPGVANVFASKTGLVTFHGRLARFNPAGYPQIQSWKCGDRNAFNSDNTTALIASLGFSRDVAKVINAALATPQGIKDSDVKGQLSVDTGSIATYGPHTWSAENLITLQGDETGTPDALTETKKFSDYYALNYADPRNRINQVTLRTPVPGSPAESVTWTAICGFEIGDTITVTTTHPGGGGFNLEPCFIEGIHYQVDMLQGAMRDVTVTLDLSPQAYFSQNPFG